MSQELQEEVTDDMADGPVLVAFSVRELFGRYDYDAVVPRDETGNPGRLMLLYGDNGSGKTTLLRLLWHILSPSDTKGHRTAIAQVPFRSFDVTFSDGSSLRALKQNDPTGTFEISIKVPGFRSVTAVYEVDSAGRIPPQDRFFFDEPKTVREYRYFQEGRMWTRSSTGKEAAAQAEYIQFLRDRAINPLFLADDRSLYSDDDALDQARNRFDPFHERPDRESASELVHRELQISIIRVNEYLRSLTLRGQNQGSMGANSIYKDVLRQLAGSEDANNAREIADPLQVDALLHTLAKKSPRFEEFELVPHFDADDFERLRSIIPSERKDIADGILVPYLSSVEARMSALDDAERLVRSLLSLLNGFLVDKSFDFSPRRGLRIVTTSGDEIPVASLSSGERQLTMLLCTTLLARLDSRLFIIDEPELSLGIPWQREVMDSLLELTHGSTLQFVVATHSVEMITSQPDRLVRLVRKVNAEQ